MEKLCRNLMTLILLVLALSTKASPLFLSMNDGQLHEGDGLAPTRTIQPQSDGFTVTYTFPAFYVNEDEKYPGTYRFNANGFGSFIEPGQPAVPYKKEFFYVPNHETAYLDIIEAEYEEFNYAVATDNYSNYMSGATLTDKVTPFDNFHKDDPINDFEGFTYKGRDVVTLSVDPILYNYKEKKIRAYKKISLKVNYSNSRNSFSNFTSPTASTNDIEFNWNKQNNIPYLVLDNTKTMLIVTAHALKETLQPFVEWKKTLGIDTYVVADSVYQSQLWTVQRIKDSISSFYDSHPDLDYILFVGDYALVPSPIFRSEDNPYYLIVEGESSKFIDCPTDFDYATITNDKLPEVLYGRLPVKTTAELKTVIDKIITYEKTPPTSLSFYSTGVHLSYIDSNKWDGKSKYTDDFDKAPFVPATEEISRYITKVASKQTNKLYSLRLPKDAPGLFTKTTKWGWYYKKEMIPDSTGLTNSDYIRRGHNDFVNELNEGRFYGMYIGHGNWDCFYNGSYYGQGDKFDANKVAKLTNKDYQPVIFSFSCLTANYIRQSIAKQLLTHPNGGCVGYFGSSSDVLLGDNELTGMAMIHSIWPNDTLKTKLSTTFYSPAKPNGFMPTVSNSVTESRLRLGAILMAGVKEMIAENDERGYKGLHCIGDPSMEFRTSMPSKISGISYYYEDSLLNVTTSSFNTRISIYDKINNQVESVIGKSYTFTTSSGKTDITLCVTAENSIPYINSNLLRVKKSENLGPVEHGFLITNCESKIPNNINVSFAIPEEANDVSLSVVGLLTGETVSINNLQTEEEDVEIRVPSSGSYVVVLKSDNEIMDSRKIIVK